MRTLAGDIERTRKALARGANLHAMTYAQLSVTGMAIENNHYDLARYLISLGGVIEADSIWFQEYLYSFLCDDMPDLFEHCVEHSEDINAPNIVSDSPLLCSVACSGEIEYVRILLKHGADVNVKDKKGLTPLTLARNEGHAEIVTLLIDHGAEGNDGH